MLSQQWFNGVPGAGPALSDRAFQYGDGLFETLRYHRGHLHWLDLHLARLGRGCERLGMDGGARLGMEGGAMSGAVLGAVSSQLRLALEWLDENHIEQARVRLSLSRGDSFGGYAAGGGAAEGGAFHSIDPAPRQFGGAAGGGGANVGQANVGLGIGAVGLPWRVAPAPAVLSVCTLRLADQPRLAGIKHGNRLEQVLAAEEARRAGADEGLLLDGRGNVVSAVAANLFAYIDGVLTTPPITTCGVAGTVRQVIMERVAPRCGLPVAEAPLGLPDLARARELVLTNALLGVRGVRRCGDQVFEASAVADALRESFFDCTEQDCTEQGRKQRQRKAPLTTTPLPCR